MDDGDSNDAEHGPPTLTAPVRPGQTPAAGAVQDEQPLRTAWAGPSVRDVETRVVSKDKNSAQIHRIAIALCLAHC
jgi:hypothetical protein